MFSGGVERDQCHEMHQLFHDRGPYRNQSIVLKSKTMEWFLYDRYLRHDRVNVSRLLSKHVVLIISKLFSLIITSIHH